MKSNSGAKHPDGYPFPNPEQELLLKAALLDGDRAIPAFYEWKRRIDFEAAMESPIYRLLSLLYHNLMLREVEDDLMPRLKGVYRKSWMTNQLLFNKAARILSFFSAHGIPTMVMKGIPLTILVYRNFAVRPMADIDILIPFPQAVSTIDLLRSDGWKMYEPEYLGHSLKYGRSVTFADQENTELDLHWHPVFEVHDTITENEFWESSVELAVAGKMTRAFCVTDQFFHTIVHGVRYNPEPPVRWVADACTLLTREGDSIRWDKVMDHTRRFRVHLQMKAALRYLSESFFQSIPAEVLNSLDQMKSSYSTMIVFRHALSTGDRNPDSLTEKFYSIYAGFMRQTSTEGFLRQHIAFIHYFRYRTKGKPWLRILRFYISEILGKNRKIRGI